jgi:hypothetical protein
MSDAAPEKPIVRVVPGVIPTGAAPAADPISRAAKSLKNVKNRLSELEVTPPRLSMCVAFVLA